jgi:hypothetical protein
MTARGIELGYECLNIGEAGIEGAGCCRILRAVGLAADTGGAAAGVDCHAKSNLLLIFSRKTAKEQFGRVIGQRLAGLSMGRPGQDVCPEHGAGGRVRCRPHGLGAGKRCRRQFAGYPQADGLATRALRHDGWQGEIAGRSGHMNAGVVADQALRALDLQDEAGGGGCRAVRPGRRRQGRPDSRAAPATSRQDQRPASLVISKLTPGYTST